jgi:hypothetical protein
MKYPNYKVTLAASTIALSVCLTSAGLAYGKNGSDDSSSATVKTEAEHTTEVENEVENEVETRKSAADAKISAAKTKLTDAKKKVCQLRSDHIQSKMTNIVAHGTKQLATFDAIADKVKAFASDHNQKPASYDALVADVAAKRQAAVEGLAAMKTDQTDFSCDGDAHGVADSFKTALKSEISLLKAYKTAVKNLIVGVKSSKSTSTDDSSTEAN